MMKLVGATEFAKVRKPNLKFALPNIVYLPFHKIGPLDHLLDTSCTLLPEVFAGDKLLVMY